LQGLGDLCDTSHQGTPAEPSVPAVSHHASTPNDLVPVTMPLGFCSMDSKAATCGSNAANLCWIA